MNKNRKKRELEEKRSRGPMFPLQIYKNGGNLNEESGEIIAPHWHNEVELILLTKGRASFKLDSSRFELKSDQLLIANKGVIHSGTARKNNSCEWYAIVFELELLNSRIEDNCQLKYLNPLLNNKYILKPFISGEDDFSENIIKITKQIIKQYYKREKGYEMKIKSLLFDLFYQYITNNKIDIVKKKSHHKMMRLKQVLAYIHDNYDKKIRLKEIAEIANLNQQYFSRFFKREIKKTPIEYINFYRVNKAKQLLQGTDSQIMEIAFDVGFNNFSYFIKVFKKFVDCTPMEYKEKLENVQYKN